MSWQDNDPEDEEYNLDKPRWNWMENNSVKVVEGEKRNELPPGPITLEFTPELTKQI